MHAPDHSVQPLNIHELLGSGEYIIPLYQRNFAWEAPEIEQLIQDIIDYSVNEKDKNYYIGTLVAAHGKTSADPWETVDGQQRLTTLYILSAALRNELLKGQPNWLRETNFRYQSRPHSGTAMKAVFQDSFPVELKGDAYDHGIRAAYRICIDAVKKRTRDSGVSVADFADYLYKYVLIIRVILPESTDLNHYFEIMNSRGEQLEKHEILKAELMAWFNHYPDEKRILYENAFDLIWTASSNMDRYLQTAFSPAQRHLIFGEHAWNRLEPESFDDFAERLRQDLATDVSRNGESIDDILKGGSSGNKKKGGNRPPESFNAVINFPNFLLHVLRLQTRDHSIPLDDKQLLPQFRRVLKEQKKDKAAFVKKFIFSLLRSRFLFDRYIIRKETGDGAERWSLQEYYYVTGSGGGGYASTFPAASGATGSDQQRIIMLLAMFHTALPSMSYKHWLSAALYHLFNENKISSHRYISWLEHIAKSFVFDNFLAVTPQSYETMIFSNEGPVVRTAEAVDLRKLRYNEIRNNLLFNFTDYLIWLRDRKTDAKIAAYTFTSRSSVEHYYPQATWDNRVDPMDEKRLHAFGNLCLISHEKNSRFGNQPPEAKMQYYPPGEMADSLKQYLMLKQPHWGENQIDTHNQEMQNLLLSSMNSDWRPGKDDSLAAKWYDRYKTEDPVLLLRALLCFDDFAKPVGNKLDLFDFDHHNRDQPAFQQFEGYVSGNEPENIQQVVDEHLQDTSLRRKWQWLMVSHPEAIRYIEHGYFFRKENRQHWRIELMRSERKSSSTVEDLLLFLLRMHHENAGDVRIYPNDYAEITDLSFNGDNFYLSPNQHSDFFLKLSNRGEGDMILCELHRKHHIHGNSAAVRKLKALGWTERGGIYGFRGRHQLCRLSGDASGDLDTVISSFSALLAEALEIFL